MTKQKFADQVESWMSIFGQHEYETEKFTADIANMSVGELCRFKHVTSTFLEFAPFMFPLWKPQYHPKLRRAIAYLTDLQHRQQIAWWQQMQEWEKEAQEVAENIKSQNFATWE